MVKTTPEPVGLSGGIADLSPFEQSILALCRRLQIEFAREGEPGWLYMWAHIGVKLAPQQRELKLGRSRGRPRISKIKLRDTKIIETAEIAEKTLNLPFSKGVNRLVKMLENKGILSADVDRTTHSKRIRYAKARLDEDRRKKALQLGMLLLKREK